MTIKATTYGGERNQYERKVYSEISFTDISYMLGDKFMDKLKVSLTEDVDFIFNNHTTVQFIHDTGMNAYIVDLYPLDVKLTEGEVEKVIKNISGVQGEIELPVLSEILDEHMNNILEEVARVKKYHPDSKLTIVFAPADTLSDVNTTAKPIYAFLVSQGEVTTLETECSFLVLPNKETSKAYGEE